MFESLSNRLTTALSGLTGKATLSDDNISATLREVRLALLEADVALEVVLPFLERVRERALGMPVTPGLAPSQAWDGASPGVTGIPSARSRTRSKNGNTTSSATSASSNARRTSRSVAEILSSLNVAFPVKPESAVVKRLLSDSNMTYSNLFTADLAAHCPLYRYYRCH